MLMKIISGKFSSPERGLLLKCGAFCKSYFVISVCRRLQRNIYKGGQVAVTIEDVARRAGVSDATVSRVLSNKPHVRPEVRERVLLAVADLGYRPSHVARSLRAMRSS